jgi:hypothetical protein
MENLVFPEWYKQAEDLYVNQNLPYYKIGEELGVHRKTVSYWLRKGGHQSNDKYVRNIVNTTRKYQVKDNIFTEINTPEKAYWLGFLFADGGINEKKNEIEIGVAEKDKDILEQLTEFLQSTYPIKEKRKYDPKYDKTYVGYRIVIASKQIVEDLTSHGCTPRKSLTLKWPEGLTPELYGHFIRGYYDGDGGLTFHKGQNTFSVEVLGTPEFLEIFKTKIPNEINSYIHPFNHVTGTHRVQIHGPNAYKFLNWIYDNNNYHLKRKREKFNNLAHLYSDVEIVPGKIGEG